MDSPALVVFDIGNVLIGFSVDRARRNFDRVEPGAGERLVRGIWRHPNGLAFERGRLTAREFHAWIRRHADVRMRYEQFRDAFIDIFTPLEENLRVLERVARRYDTALLSNVNPIHWRFLLARYSALRRARWRFGSHRIGHMKPSTEAYRAVARRTRVPLSRMAYVDDRPEFVRAAARLGISARVYDGRRSLAAVLAAAGVAVPSR